MKSDKELITQTKDYIYNLQKVQDFFLFFVYCGGGGGGGFLDLVSANISDPILLTFGLTCTCTLKHFHNCIGLIA